MNTVPPPSLFKSAGRRKSNAAFTLVELLVVIAIIGILTAVVIPMKGKLDAINIRGAAELAEAQFSLARQTAMSRNLPVEVRIYERTSTNGLAGDTMALVIPKLVSGKAVNEWIGAPSVFSVSVIIDPDKTQFSTLLNTGTNSPPSASPTSTPPVAPWPATEPTTAATPENSVPPAALRGVSYVAFQFRPDGSTNLPIQVNGTAQPWCISLRSSNGRPAAGVPAANYASLILDPLTGRTLSYQP